MTAGAAFITLDNTQQVRELIQCMNFHAFDKKHTVVASSFDEFDEALHVKEEFVTPKSSDLLDLNSYQFDVDNDQYFVKYKDSIQVRLNLAQRNQYLEDNYEVLTDIKKIGQKSFTTWSPKGTFLVIVGNSKIQLYGGSDWEIIKEFVHYGSSYVSFSPCERYMYTYAQNPPPGSFKYHFWNIDTQLLI